MAGMRLERRVEGFHPKKTKRGMKGRYPLEMLAGKGEISFYFPSWSL
jgi:hypothetical protein